MKNAYTHAEIVPDAVITILSYNTAKPTYIAKGLTLVLKVRNSLCWLKTRGLMSLCFFSIFEKVTKLIILVCVDTLSCVACSVASRVKICEPSLKESVFLFVGGIFLSHINIIVRRQVEYCS